METNMGGWIQENKSSTSWKAEQESIAKNPSHVSMQGPEERGAM